MEAEWQAAYRFAFVMEQTLGHRAHFHTLSRLVEEDVSVVPVWLPIEFAGVGWPTRVPGIRRNWSARASLLAWDAVHHARHQRLDAIFYHTQVTALLSPLQRAAPAVLSLDATPRNYDTVGRAYGHASGGWAERLKLSINRAAFARAAALVTWCDWARDSLIQDYGIAPERITTLAPGVDLARWQDPAAARQARLDRGGRPRLLFVGGDFARKGGELLLECFTRDFAERCELWLVTSASLAPRPGVRVFSQITPESGELPRLYAEADIFVFPTLADCAPLVVPEAMAAALPVISTSVGAIPEMVEDGVTGLLIEPGSRETLRAAIERLLAASEVRTRLGDAGRRTVEARYDARLNARVLLDLLKRVSASPRGAKVGSR
ncbi:MAG: glycosyltransferase family 4 protein [Ktedonobacterales bacterium]|nr:glycosyltransferase family 4 protein [Ktedonobacterales bacterium]